MAQVDGQPFPDGQQLPNGDSLPADASTDTAEGTGNDHAAGKAAAGNPIANKPGSLGTGFVPKSPQLTAEMMAGAKAQQAAQKALGQQQQLPFDPQLAKNQQVPPGQTTDAQEGQQIPSEHSTSSKLTKKEGSATINQKVKDGAIEKLPEGTEAAGKTTTKTREKEDNILARQLKNETWFAKLPPELRKSIRAGAGQKPPRAYEERLKKYFESVD
jgi:hypothetical protein